MSERHYSDAALETFVNDLDDNERAGLRFGMLPAEPFANLEPPLSGADVAYMMRYLDGDSP
jgi:hypothetical protein